MPFKIDHLGTQWAGPLEIAVRGDAWSDGSGLVLLDELLGRRIVVQPGADAAPVLLPTGAFNPAARVGVQMPDGPASLSRAVLMAALADPGRDGATWLQSGAAPASIARVMVVEGAGATTLLLASGSGSGIVSYRVAADGTLSARQVVPDSAPAYLSQVSAMASLTLDGHRLVTVASGVAPGVSVLQLDASGAISAVAHLGMVDGWPVAGITALASAVVAGQGYVIVGAAGTDSLSVLQVAANGALTPVDHVMDTLQTRFAGVRLVETVTVADQVFVLVAGSDDGLSLFALLSGGLLLHLDSLSDTLDSALSNADWLHAVADGDGIRVLAGSGAEAGVSQFRIDLSALGWIGVMTGGARRDIIRDGPGADNLRGGAGADLFVLQSDGQIDRIVDFQLGLDRLDLSFWPMFRGLHQLIVTETATGLRLRFGDEVLEMTGAEGVLLREIHLWQMLAQMPDRIAFSTGPIEVATAPPPSAQLTPPPPPPAAQVPGNTEQPPDPPPPGGGVTTPGPGVSNGKRETGGPGADTLIGTPYADALSGQGGNDLIEGRGGDDTLSGGDGNDTINGGDGNDLIGGGLGNDRLIGGKGDDTIGGGAGDDTIFLNSGNDVGSGGPGNDSLYGGAGNDMLSGGFGNDSIDGGGGDDQIGGGPGRDTLLGGLGNDRIGGGEGDDWIDGGSGNDFLAGGGRDDTIHGGAGRDTINGGAGNDRLFGGAGADLFVFNQLVSGERDVIGDFEPGTDVIRMSGVAGSGQAGRFAALDITALADGARVSHAGHDIILTGVSPDILHQADFLFI